MSIQDFINECAQTCFDLIPNEFVEQAENSQKYFTVTDKMLKENLVRIVLEDISENDNGISFRARIAGMMDAEGNLVALRRDARGQSPAGQETWLKGFRTGRLTLTQEHLDAGVLSQQDVDALLDHARLWAEMGNAMYEDKQYSRQRLFLTTKDSTGLFRFVLEERQNPTSGAEYPVVPGVAQPSWRAMHIIGTGVRQTAEFGDFDFSANNIADDVAQVTRKRTGRNIGSSNNGGSPLRRNRLRTRNN